MINRRLHTACPTCPSLDLPRISPLVVDQPRIIIAFVEVFENGGKDFGLFVWEGDAFARRFHELASAGGLEEGRYTEDVFVSGEEALFAADDEGNY
jgi:hypothetical protein